MNKKSKSLAYLLWLFGGWFGAHNFYSHEKKKAIIKISCLVVLLLIIIIDAFALFFIPITVLLILCIIDMFTLGKIIDKYNVEENSTSTNNDKKNEIINKTNIETLNETSNEANIEEKTSIKRKEDFMASWDEVIEYIEKKYPTKKNGDLLSTVIPLKNERSQVVFFQERSDNDEENVWLNILSPIGELSSRVKIDSALNFLSLTACGGLIKVGDNYFLRHGILIRNISANEIELPIRKICICADLLEEELLGVDKS